MPGLRAVDPSIRYLLYRFAVICGILNSIGVTIAFRVMSEIHGGLIRPGDSAETAAAAILDQREGLLWGIVIVGITAPLFYWFAVVTSLQMCRIEGGWGLLSMTQLVTAVVAPPGYLYPLAVLATAAYRPDRDPEIILALSDQFWLTFVGVAAILCVNIFSIGIAALVDRRRNPVFPRWSGWVFILLGIVFFPGIFVYVNVEGPLAWDGLLTSKVPGYAFLVFIILLTVLLWRAVSQQKREEFGPSELDSATEHAAHRSERRRQMLDLWDKLSREAEDEAQGRRRP